MTSKKIMIIDDDPDILSSIEEILESNGHKVISIQDAGECFERLKKGEKPHLIILDIMMPVMNGWEVQRKLDANPEWRKIPVVFLTGRTTETAIEMCKKYGIDYIKKPFDIEDLKKRIDKALKTRRNN